MTDPSAVPSPQEPSRPPATRSRATAVAVVAGIVVATLLGIGSPRSGVTIAAWSAPGSDAASSERSENEEVDRASGAWTAPFVEPPQTSTPPPATTAPTTTVPPAPPARPSTWYAPYVDLTLTPRLDFEDPAANPAEHTVLGFVVADPAEGCTPSWGGAYGLDEAAETLDLDARIARYRTAGGDVIASFGGFANDELAVTCLEEGRLAAAYRSVVDRYDLSTIDLDIEGDALDDGPSITRRARAVAAVQREADAAGRPLAVWLTLPVSPVGLDASARAVVDATLAAGVRLAGVNVMAMNYGASRSAGTSMEAANRAALEATHGQLADAYRRAGSPLTDADVWARVGATPMLGVNDETADVFTPADARALLDLASDRGLGRVSMWSANRDAPCTEPVGPTGVSNHCSGVDQAPLAFSRLFAELPGSPAG